MPVISLPDGSDRQFDSTVTGAEIAAGIGEGLMSRAVNADGTLTYAFIEILASKYPYYAMRLLGGTVYFFGMCVMAYNVFKTIAKEKPVPVAVMEPA